MCTLIKDARNKLLEQEVSFIKKNTYVIVINIW